VESAYDSRPDKRTLYEEDLLIQPAIDQYTRFVPYSVSCGPVLHPSSHFETILLSPARALRRVPRRRRYRVAGTVRRASGYRWIPPARDGKGERLFQLLFAYRKKGRAGERRPFLDLNRRLLIEVPEDSCSGFDHKEHPGSRCYVEGWATKGSGAVRRNIRGNWDVGNRPSWTK
jgi:hypothetical protein